jgi:signal transduction histidine kinase
LLRLRRTWRRLRPALGLLLLGFLVLLALYEPLAWWLRGQEQYDQEALREWLEEARVFRETLPEMVSAYLELADRIHQVKKTGDDLKSVNQQLAWKREEIHEHLKSLGNPPTKMYPGQLPLFPVIYRIKVCFADELRLKPIEWDSELPRQPGQYRELEPIRIHPRGAQVALQYQLHAYTQQQYKERQEVARRFWLAGMAVVVLLLVGLRFGLSQRQKWERERQRALAEQEISRAERKALQEELRRQEAERRQQEAERTALELQSQLFANIGIMAGAYAHNIKNLLVRPNDLLGRCLEGPALQPEHDHMLREVRQTLGTVTERLQQILQTVRRDPTRPERVRIDLNVLVRDMQRTWENLARDRWKLELRVDLETGEGQKPQPLWIEGDLSHLQQAVENLLFNARDATFEMRNRLREQARRQEAKEEVTGQAPRVHPPGVDLSPSPTADRRQALIAAAAWRGTVVLRTRRDGERALLEVQDNGIGMTEEVRRRCTETHFSTKRNNALFAGLSAGMGLGLSFVVVILEHHQARLEIESQPLQGTTFRIVFPLVAGPAPGERAVK